MEQTKHNYVAVAYKLTAIDDEGSEMVEEATENSPYQFLTGFGITLADFEAAVAGLATGEEFNFIIPQERAYGEYMDERVVALDRSVFTVNGHFDHENIYVDAIIPLQNEDGVRFQAQVVEITDDKVTVDLNHPLAGCALNFVGHIVENRPATDNEIAGVIARMSGDGCSCDCCHGHDDDGGCSHSHGGDDGCCHGDGCC